jgi:hypothetical protein
VFASAPLATIPVSFFDPQTGLSALAVQHLRVDGRVALVYHDAPGVASARPLLGAIATTLMAELREGQTLSVIESSVPEHPAEPFIYAQVALASVPNPERVNAGLGRVIGVAEVARACGIDAREVERTQVLVVETHRPRACAFPGFRQLVLGERARDGLAAA